jgi:hypothetical protein
MVLVLPEICCLQGKQRSVEPIATDRHKIIFGVRSGRSD